MRLRLSDIARSLELASHCGDVTVTGLAIDSRLVEPGDLFVAIAGQRVDGHDYISSAIARGAVAVVSERPISQDIPHVIASDAMAACGHVARLVRAEFSGKVIGITGSAGKTTAKSFLAAICSGAGTTVATEGNQNNELGVPLTLAKLNSAAAFAVVEMGAAQMGDIAYLKSMASPQVVILLNAREAHVERFGSLEAIVAAKGEILDNLSEHDTAILNADEPELAAWRARAQPAQVLTFGRSSAADIRLVSNQDRGFDGSVMNVDICGTPALWRISIPGEPGMVNALAAAAAAQALGIEDKTISDGLASVTPVRGRGDIRQLQNGIRLIDDSYNASPSSVMAALNLLSSADAPRTAVLADMLELGDEAVTYHCNIGERIAELGIERLLAVGELSKHISDLSNSQTRHYKDVAALIADSPAFGANETVLIKGSRAMQLDRFVDAMCESLGGTSC